MKIPRLIHGGIMVNYRCNAACRHCLYACSPTRRAGYVTPEKIREICESLAKARIGSVHIGGGEPFLDFPGLCTVIRTLAGQGIQLDYIETNAFWARNSTSADWIEILKNEGAGALCISIDPFHAEYVPWAYPLELAQACEKQGMDYFLWKGEFARYLSALDRNKRHSHGELAAALSPDYVEKTASAYGIRLGGRAVNIEETCRPPRPVDTLLDKSPCTGLLSSSHFHVDLEGFFIPPGCTGLRLPLEELLSGIDKEYPVFQILYSGGIAALYQFAVERGFIAVEKGYPSKCNLCFHLRKFLSPLGFVELDKDFYGESLKYY